jgi:uncharacterized protein (DUF2062 family)
MLRRRLQKIVPAPQSLRERWFLRPFGQRLADPQLWTLHRRGVTHAFGAGLAICFVPLPVHLPLAASVALAWRLNIPVACGTTFLVNPFTVWPVYYLAYRVGAALLQSPQQHFHFHLSWAWLRHGLTPMWAPLIAGCVVCGVLCGVAGWAALELLWRWSVRNRYRTRHAAQSA